MSNILFGLSEYGMLTDNANGVHLMKPICEQEVTASTTHDINFDLGVNYLTFFDIPNLLVFDDLATMGCTGYPLTVSVWGSNSAVFASPTIQSFPVLEFDLIGINGQSWATNLNFASKFRYWKVRVVTPLAVRLFWGAVSLGKAFNFSRCSSFGGSFLIDDSRVEARRNSLDFDMFFYGVSESEKVSLDWRILQFGKRIPLFLVDFNDTMLFGKKVIRAYIEDVDVSIAGIGKTYDIKLRVKELV